MADVALLVVGGSAGGSSEPGGRETSRLSSLASSLGIAERCLFLPAQPHERLPDYYAAAEAVLVPSRSESFGLVALEAQACGTPVIAARTGGLVFVVRDRVTGFLVRGDSPAQYAESLLALLGDQDLARRMGRAGVAHALRYSWDATAAGILEVYGELLGRGGAHPSAAPTIPSRREASA
jgi:D-inositol-3-phosphate glycosyltransferase